MAEDWQLEAVHEQFKFFECLTTAHTEVSPDEIGGLINKVKNVIQRHLRIESATQTSHKSVRQISSTIISKSADNETFHFTFILIVTDTEVNGSLCTIPLFVITSRNKHVFIDVSCNVYNSWNAFMKNNDLPPCKFCFPVDGKYSVGGKLKIDFAKSPAASQNVSRLWIYGGIFIGVGVAAFSCFYHVRPIVYTCFTELIPLAEKFVGNFQPKLGRYVLDLSKLVQLMRYGSDSKIVISLQLFKALVTIYSDYQNEIRALKDDVLKLFGRVCDSVRRFFSKVFNSNSSVSGSFEILAITSSINNEVIDTSNSAERLLQAQRANQYEENVCNEVREPVYNNRACLQIDNNMSSAKQLFENCRNESACSSKCKSQDPLSPVTVNLLKHTERIYENIKKEDSNLNDIADILLSLKDFAQDKYKSKIDTYTKSITAARVAAGHEINLDQYNRSLGIEGDPEHYFWDETFREIETSTFLPHILKAVNKFKKQKKIELIPFNEGNEENRHYFYKCIGNHRDGTISTPDLVCALKDLDVVNFDEENLVINETTTLVSIRSTEFTAFLLKTVDEPDSISNGILYLEKEESFPRES